MTKLGKVNNFPNGKAISKLGLWFQMCRPLNSDTDVFPTEICLYIKKGKNPMIYSPGSLQDFVLQLQNMAMNQKFSAILV